MRTGSLINIKSPSSLAAYLQDIKSSTIFELLGHEIVPLARLIKSSLDEYKFPTKGLQLHIGFEDYIIWWSIKNCPDFNHALNAQYTSGKAEAEAEEIAQSMAKCIENTKAVNFVPEMQYQSWPINLEERNFALISVEYKYQSIFYDKNADDKNAGVGVLLEIRQLGPEGPLKDLSNVRDCARIFSEEADITEELEYCKSIKYSYFTKLVQEHAELEALYSANP